MSTQSSHSSKRNSRSTQSKGNIKQQVEDRFQAGDTNINIQREFRLTAGQVSGMRNRWNEVKGTKNIGKNDTAAQAPAARRKTVSLAQVNVRPSSADEPPPQKSFVPVVPVKKEEPDPPIVVKLSRLIRGVWRPVGDERPFMHLPPSDKRSIRQQVQEFMAQTGRR